MNTMIYKGYIGSVEASLDDGVLYGRLLHIRDLVSYEAENLATLKAEFRSAVDDYLTDCSDAGVSPDKPYKGQFNVRVGADLHRDLVASASERSISLNEYVGQVLGCHHHLELAEKFQSNPATIVMVAGRSRGAPRVRWHKAQSEPPIDVDRSQRKAPRVLDWETVQNGPH